VSVFLRTFARSDAEQSPAIYARTAGQLGYLVSAQYRHLLQKNLLSICPTLYTVDSIAY